MRPLLALAIAACAGKEGGPARSPDADADADADTDTVVTAPYGLLERPHVTTCVAPDRPPTGGTAIFTRVFPALSWSEGTSLGQAPGDGDHWYVTLQGGLFLRFDDDPNVASATTVLDLQAEVDSGGELGLLGFAFHPSFQQNGYVYLSYTAIDDGGGLVSRITRFHSPDGGATLDPASELVIFEMDQPYVNHNGGWIEFGNDGYLYAGYGDGGSGDDPQARAQDPDELHGKFLRFDVDHPSDGKQYGIPPDNPYSQGGGAPEVYAIGLRNPYRWHFDPLSGQLWVGDVGQDLWEEVDQVELGGNYGWDCIEGFDLHPDPDVRCPAPEAIAPLAVYEHPDGASYAVMGGLVYHGTAIPDLEGVYLYADFYTTALYGLGFDPATGAPASYVVNPASTRSVAHWAYGDDGEVYILSYLSGVWRLDPAVPVADDFPRTLSATGCVDPSNPTRPNDQVIPYDVTHPFWSDGATKSRWLAIPDGTEIGVAADGDLDLPIGTVLLKQFEKDGQLIETRLLARHSDGGWGGYAYRWRADGSDADLLDGALSVELPSEDWLVPSPAECMQCHTEVAGGSLGLETRQLNSSIVYPATGYTANQLATLEHLGMFASSPGDPASITAFPAIDDEHASVEDRARTWLHVNCSQCHRPDGPAPVDLDLRFDTPLSDTHLCDPAVEGDLGLGDGALRVSPGDPAASVLSDRIRRRDAFGMPPIGTSVPDEVGADVIDAWIAGLTTCP